MKKSDYTQEFKEQVLKECQEVGNVAVVARRHNISANTIHTWRRKVRKTGSTKLLPTDQTRRIKELEARVEKFSTENDYFASRDPVRSEAPYHPFLVMIPPIRRGIPPVITVCS